MSIRTPRTSNVLRSSVALAAASLVSTATAHAQITLPGNSPPQIYQGMSASWAAGYSLSVATNDDIIIKAPGGAPVPTNVWGPVSGSGGPDYGRNVMFPNDHESIDIVAHSSGNGVVPRMGPNGELAVALIGGWFGVVASVTNSTGGLAGDPGALIRQARAAAGGPGSTLFGSYLLGSTGIPNQLIENAVVEVTHDGQNFAPSLPGSPPEIDALDFGLGMFTHNSIPRSQWLFFRNRDEYYFSVSYAWANRPGVTRFADPDTSGQPMNYPDARCIYVIRWNGSSWSVPETFVSETEFGLPETADLDAIEVDLQNKTFLFSTVDLSHTASQIMFAQRALGGHSFSAAQSPVPLPGNVTGAAGQSTATRLGLGNVAEDNVDSLCGIDPESNVTCAVVGVPRLVDPAYGTPFGLSVARRIQENDEAMTMTDELVLQVDGWGVAGIGGMDIVQYQYYSGPLGTNSPMPDDEEWVHLWADLRGPGDQSMSFRVGGVTSGGNLSPVNFRAVGYRMIAGVPVKVAQSWTSEIRP